MTDRLPPQCEAESAVDALTNFVVDLAAKSEPEGHLSEETIRTIDQRLERALSAGRAESVAELAAVRAERDEARRQLSVVKEFVAARAEYVTALRNCHPDNGHDYDRWQGHAAARRQLAEQLGLPIAWPAEDEAVAR